MTAAKLKGTIKASLMFSLGGIMVFIFGVLISCIVRP